MERNNALDDFFSKFNWQQTEGGPLARRSIDIHICRHNAASGPI